MERKVITGILEKNIFRSSIFECIAVACSSEHCQKSSLFVGLCHPSSLDHYEKVENDAKLFIVADM